jgi:hypothetical protein
MMQLVVNLTLVCHTFPTKKQASTLVLAKELLFYRNVFFYVKTLEVNLPAHSSQ